MPLGNKVPRDSFHEKLESLASQEFPTYFCHVQIRTKQFETKLYLVVHKNVIVGMITQHDEKMIWKLISRSWTKSNYILFFSR